MKNPNNEIYALVDEEYLSKFSYNQLIFMKEYYYKFYHKFCEYYERKPLSSEEFFKNMRRRRIRLYQLCCPYCGAVEVIPYDKKEFGTAGYNYCSHCGRGSTVRNLLDQISRFIRINGINRLGLKEFQKTHSDVEEWLLAYDCYQMEIVELTSIIEVVFRDIFEALLFINGFNKTTTYYKYVNKIVQQQNGNDFMNVDKANNHYKKAFGINLKDLLEEQVWNDLIDMVVLRNMMIHNNGRMDERFKSTPTYMRLQDHVEGDLFRLEDTDLAKYLKSVIVAVSKITDIYLEKYYIHRNATVANFYFNNSKINFEELFDIE